MNDTKFEAGKIQKGGVNEMPVYTQRPAPPKAQGFSNATMREVNQMSVRAKFYCATKTVQGNQPNPSYPTIQTTESVELYPVTGGSEENKQFFQSTPSGKIELRIMNPEASKQFEVGKAYYINFEPAE